MPRERDSAHATTHQRRRLSPKEKAEHKQRVLTHGAPSVTGSIADAVVVKNGNLFFLTDERSTTIDCSFFSHLSADPSALPFGKLVPSVF